MSVKVTLTLFHFKKDIMFIKNDKASKDFCYDGERVLENYTKIIKIFYLRFQ